MNNKKKQTAAVAMATVIGVSNVMNPEIIKAQEKEPSIVQGVSKDHQSESHNAELAKQEIVKEQSRKLRNSIPTTYAVGDVVINETNFPDAGFRAWLKGKSYGQDEKITQAEIADIKEIKVSGNSNIKDLKGIEHFTALTYLDCSNTGITSLDVSNNQKLIKLYCGNTKITSLDVSKNPDLNTLHCFSTGITSLDVSKNLALESLDCYSTKITSLDVSENKELTGLNCFSTGITSLDVSENTKLTSLNCFDTPLAYLNIGTNSKLTTVNKSDLKAVELEMTEDTFNMADKFAGIDKSKIFSVSGADYNSETGIMSNYKAGKPITYTYDCGTLANGTKQEISVKLNLKGYTESIKINKANFPDAGFRTWLQQQTYGKDGKITQAEIEDIKEINVSGNSNIKDLTGIAYFTALTKLYCNSTKITSLDVSNNTKLQTLWCHENKELKTLNVNDVSTLTTLNCFSTGISSLVVSSNVNLTNLNCYSTGISGLNVSKNAELITLNCSKTDIKNLDVSSNDKLTGLYCYETSITNLDVSKNVNLITLNCSSNLEQKTLIVNGASALTDLNCSSTSITNLDVSKNANLTNLNCSSNLELKTLIVNGASALTDLYCSETSIINLDVSSNTKLTDLYCSSNSKLKTLNVNGASALTTLNCSSTGITSLDVHNNGNLTSLNCSNTTLAYLNLGTNAGLNVSMPTAATMKLEVTEDTFIITDKITDIDKSKVSIKSGASYNPSTGVVSGYTAGTPIVYEYDCGTAKNEKKTLEVTVSLTGLKAESTISIIDSLNKVYDGNAVNNTPTISKTGSTGSVTYKWEKKKNATEWDLITSAPTNAGTYRVTATVEADRNYKGATSQPMEFTITQADSSISITDNLNKTFDGKAVSATPKVDKKGSTGEVTYKWEKKKNATEWEVITTAPTKAGTYRVTATVASDSNYKGVTSQPVEFSIAQADSSISITSDLTKTYDGNAVSSKPKVDKKGSTGAVTYKWEKKNNASEWEEITSPPTEAGTYRVIATVASDNNYKGATSQPVEFTIAQADSSISITSDLTKTYDGKAVSATVDKKGSTGAVTYKWEKKKNATEWEDIASAPMDVGTYRVTATVASDSNYKGATSQPMEFTITQADSSISITDNLNKTFDGKAVSATPKVDKKGSTGEVTYKWEKKKNATEWEVITTAPTNAGIYRVTATVALDSNYKGATSQPVEFTIAQADNSWTENLAITGWTYGETANKPTATAKFGDVVYTYCDSETGTYTDTVPTDAGIWYVKAHVLGTNNYEGLESGAVQFEIKKASAPKIVLPENLSGEHDVALSDIALPDGWKWMDKTQKLTTSGAKYQAYLIVDDKNYDYTNVEGYDSNRHCVEKTLFVTVSSTANGWIVEPSITNWVYQEKASVPKADAKYGDVVFTYSDAKTGVFTSEVPTTAGTWYMKASVSETSEYTGLTMIVKFTITQADNSWTENLAIKDWTYGETANKPTATAKFGDVVYTYCDSETGTYTDTVPTDAGIWYVKAHVLGTNNYKGLESGAVQFEIKKASAPKIVLPENLSGEHDVALSDIALPDGWKWMDETQKLTTSGAKYQAYLIVDDKNYDYTNVEGYDSNRHCVEKTLFVTVSMITNGWIVEPSITDWVYQEKASVPKADAKYGDVVFTYSDAKTGVFTSEVPTTAGTWYMKASVGATSVYTGLTSIVEFTIEQAVPDVIIPSNLQAVYGQTLKDITLPTGFTWNDQTLSVGNAGVNEFVLTYTPDDSNYKVVDDLVVRVTVAQAENAVIQQPLLNGWIYGDTPSSMSSEFYFGQPYYLFSDRIDGRYTDTIPTAAGTWYVKAVVDRTKNYKGAESEVVSFVIEPKSIEAGSLELPKFDTDTDVDSIVLKDGEKVLIQGIDYDISKVKNGTEVTITIRLKGNYSGTMVKTYTLDDKESSESQETDKDETKPSDQEHSKNDDVQTGDTTAVGLWAMLMAIITGVTALWKGKKSKEE